MPHPGTHTYYTYTSFIPKRMYTHIRTVHRAYHNPLYNTPEMFIFTPPQHTTFFSVPPQTTPWFPIPHIIKSSLQHSTQPNTLRCYLAYITTTIHYTPTHHYSLYHSPHAITSHLHHITSHPTPSHPNPPPLTWWRLTLLMTLPAEVFQPDPGVPRA